MVCLEVAVPHRACKGLCETLRASLRSRLLSSCLRWAGQQLAFDWRRRLSLFIWCHLLGVSEKHKSAIRAAAQSVTEKGRLHIRAKTKQTCCLKLLQLLQRFQQCHQSGFCLSSAAFYNHPNTQVTNGLTMCIIIYYYFHLVNWQRCIFSWIVPKR